MSYHRQTLLRLCLLSVVILSISACDNFRRSTPPATTIISEVTQPTVEPTEPATSTPLPPTPTRPPTAVPQPTPTLDPNLPEWTVMVYMTADNTLELSGLLDINEMEAAGSSEEVNLLVQVDRAIGGTDIDGDWTDTRRYIIGGDKDPNLISSETVAFLGELNMGDPAVLADFLTWGVSSYPANRYALVLWDHGAGWSGIAFDTDQGVPAVGTANEADPITLPELEEALTGALAQNGLDKLDLVGFDACLMGQLDVFQAVQPYAEYAIASEELTPGQGWDYHALMSWLYGRPDQDGVTLARQIVTDFASFYTRSEPDDFVTIAAVDLSRIPDLAYAVEQLAGALMIQPSFVASAVGDARGGAEAYARVYADEFDRYAAIDLHHFASILAQRSPDERVVEAAEKVMAEVESAVIAEAHGAGFRNSGGISLYFPRTAEFYAEPYRRLTAIHGWDEFMASYYTTGQAEIPPPQIEFTNLVTSAISLQNPAYLEFEIIGRDIENVTLVGGRYEVDGRSRLLEYDYLIPEPFLLPDDNEIVEWRDGVHEDFFIWPATVTYLFDAEGNGDFVVMWPTEYGSSLFTVQGRYRQVSGEDFVNANLVFDHSTGRLTRVWGSQGEAAAEISPGPGDEFQLVTLYRNQDGVIEREPGPSLLFDQEGQLNFEWRPLPDGDYFLGFVAQNTAGETAPAFTDLTIDNSQNQPGQEAYLDPYLGFQFLYPESYFPPVYEGSLLYTTNLSGTTQLQVTTYPDLDRGTNPRHLANETLNQFGAVDLLYPAETVVIGGYGGQRTAYGYENSDSGSRTGVFLTFIKDNTGFVVDVDGPATQESATIAVVDKLVESWQFRSVNFGLRPGKWSFIDLESFSVAQPADFAYQEFNGWQRFSSGRNTFVALRTQPATIPTDDVLAALIRDSGSGVDNFSVNEPFLTSLSGAVWQRADFRYTAANGDEIWGFLMVKVEDETEVVAWAEAPATVYNDLETNIFMVMIADMSLAE